MKTTFRNASPRDIDQIIEINLDSLAENYTRESWDNLFNDPECLSHTYVAVRGEEVIGYVLSFDNLIVSFAIEVRYRGKGVGRELIKRCLNSHLSCPEGFVTLHVRVSNIPALSLYSILGFEETERYTDYYKNPTEDGIVMVRNMAYGALDIVESVDV